MLECTNYSLKEKMKLNWWNSIQLILIVFYVNLEVTSSTECVSGCTCNQRFWFTIRYIDCSNRGFTKVPKGPFGNRDYLILKGNNIKAIQHTDFEQYKDLYGLDLRDNPIGNMPSALFFNLQNLRELLITVNKIHHFAFHGLNELTTLRIEGSKNFDDLHVSLLKPLANKLSNITITNTRIKSIKTHSMAGMKSLSIADLRNNQIQMIGNDSFHGSTRLTVVLLGNNNMSSLPKNFQLLNSLRELDFSSNHISYIHKEAFSGLHSLRKLDLSHNSIEKLDEALFDGLTSLSQVLLQGNMLDAIPTALLPSKCNTLQILDLSDNKFTSFDYSNGTCASLYSLKLGGNRLTHLNLNSLRRLATLDLSRNCRLNFTSDVTGLTLSNIDLSQCCLERLPLYFNRYNTYRRLTSLNLHGNKFKTFTMTFPIINLNMSSNQLENFTIGIRAYYTYNTFDLSNNNLSTISRKSAFARISNLILSNNQFTTFNNLVWIQNIQTLDLSFNKLQKFDSTKYIFSQYFWVAVKELNLRGNLIKNITTQTLSKFIYIQKVDISDNQINVIPKNAFLNLRYLVSLNVSHNLLTEISKEFSKVYYLQMIDLSGNRIRTIEQNAFQGMRVVKEIRLRNNLLQTLPSTLTAFVTVTNLVLLDVSGNNLTCSCDLTITLSYYRNVRPKGTCKSNSGDQPLHKFVKTLDELTKENCNLCPLSPCKYNGHCLSNATHGFQCECHEGFSGRLCDVAKVDCLNNTCQICKPSTCQNGGTCIEDEGRATCLCQLGYSGDRCQNSSCHPVNPCKNNGVCSPNGDGFKCRCQVGYTGNECQNSSCYPKDPCKNNGVCFVVGETFQCQCPIGFFGSTCQSSWCYPINPCQNNGTCSVNKNHFQCKCPKGYNGTTCEVLQNKEENGENKKGPTFGKSSAGADEAKKGMSASLVAVVALVILLAIAIVAVMFLLYKHAYLRNGAWKKTFSKKDDKIDLSQDF